MSHLAMSLSMFLKAVQFSSHLDSFNNEYYLSNQNKANHYSLKLLANISISKFISHVRFFDTGDSY